MGRIEFGLSRVRRDGDDVVITLLAKRSFDGNVAAIASLLCSVPCARELAAALLTEVDME